jgi:probable F420-dependent oxidoreductase
VRLGFTTMNTPDDVRPDVLARALEDRGYDSLWIGEHSHIPASRLTPYPTGGEMPNQYRTMMDPFISLTLAAAATTDLIVATGVALALEHDIFDLAKTVSTLDVLSNGRLKFGVGCGWNEEELANHRPDISWARRYIALEECVAALRALWTTADSEHHGEYFNFDAVWSFPKPLQRPHPPVVCGMSGRMGFKHAIAWADEWNPMDLALGNVPKRINTFRAAAADAGRDHIPITITTFGDPTLETLELYRSLGVERVVVGASREGWHDPATTMPFMNRYAAYVPGLL